MDDHKEIAAEVIKRVEFIDPMTCPTCGKKMELSLVGKVNPVYVTLCPNPVVEHQVFVCAPAFYLAK